MKKIGFTLITTAAFVMIFSLKCAVAPGPLSETLIVKFSDSEAKNVKEIKYDKTTGAYAYEYYDSSKNASYVAVKNGKSEYFTGFGMLYSVFDKQGNFYCTAYMLQSDSSVKYSIIKNTEVIASFNKVFDNWIEKDGKIFFAATENGKTFMAALDVNSGSITKGKLYDDIRFASFPNQSNMNEELDGFPGFTKDGKPYYIAVAGKKKMLVVGDAEQKEYADIDPYSVTFDNNNQPAYIVNDVGGQYDDKSTGNYFLVQGTMEYKKFNYVMAPVIFDRSNTPYYMAEIKGSVEGRVSAMLIAGEKVFGSKYTEGVSYLQLTPQGKVAFIGYYAEKDAKSKCCLVIDSREGKKYDAINNLTFTHSGTPMYVADLGEREFIVKGEEQITAADEHILEFDYTPNGKLIYTTFEEGNSGLNQPSKYYMHIGTAKHGPYEDLRMAGGDGFKDSDELRRGLQTDGEGNFAALTYRMVETKRFLYDYRVITSKGQSDKYDDVKWLKIAGGKTYYSGHKIVDTATYTTKGKIYCDFNPMTEEFDYVSDCYDVTVNHSLGFVAIRDGEAYWIEIKY